MACDDDQTAKNNTDVGDGGCCSDTCVKTKASKIENPKVLFTDGCSAKPRYLGLQPWGGKGRRG